jgi:hypothetical protein
MAASAPAMRMIVIARQDEAARLLETAWRALTQRSE